MQEMNKYSSGRFPDMQEMNKYSSGRFPDMQEMNNFSSGRFPDMQEMNNFVAGTVSCDIGKHNKLSIYTVRGMVLCLLPSASLDCFLLRASQSQDDAYRRSLRGVARYEAKQSGR
jgi:hypothetical protein